ncbi:hypothetical protein MC7420_8076 [Coleofasciculus chthonoplastes PCC 7420]|uniref:Uncharacterized protein n=1 Tax=Coleofasciculus chthonoplastes PCC 7420 TaxID=118168 RepID=B4W5I8_9CYAN|nr:hypothetical protein MC7420_8076 [Coleofasciculus chthonoplastes PCC 7420]
MIAFGYGVRLRSHFPLSPDIPCQKEWEFFNAEVRSPKMGYTPETQGTKKIQ